MNLARPTRPTKFPDEYTYQISLPLWRSVAPMQGRDPASKQAGASGYRITGARVIGSTAPYLFAAGCIHKSASVGKSQVDMRSVVSSLNGTFFSAEQK